MAALAADFDKATQGDRGAIHRVRVASRRLRVALPIAAGAGADATTETLARDIRRVTRALADVREIDVVISLLRKLGEKHGWRQSAVSQIDDHCTGARARRLASARKSLSRLERDALKSQTRSTLRDVTRARSAAATVGLLTEIRRRTRDLVLALHQAGVVYAVEPLHEIRLAAKKLRYTLELAAHVPGGAMKRATRRLKHFQDDLGEMHDAQMAQRYVRQLLAQSPAHGMAIELARIDGDLEIQCRRLHAAVVKSRPRLHRVLEDVLVAATSELSPRRLGAVAKMRPAASTRRTAAGQ